MQAEYCNADLTTWKLTLQDINKSAGRLIFLVHPSQRPLRPRKTLPWSIARYLLLEFSIFHTWDA